METRIAASNGKKNLTSVTVYKHHFLKQHFFFLTLKGGIDILIDHTIYSNYSSLTNDSVNVGSNLSISKPEDNCLEVSFPSLTSVKFCEKKEMMSFIVTPGDDYKNTTKGLLGTWNDNPNDDFTLPDGTELPSALTLREIHFKFGVKCK